MIVGNGLIGSLFKEFDRQEVIFFASGVSNSLETDPAQFLREENLVRQTLQQAADQLFVYFSTCSIYDSSKTDSLYVRHKLRMEQLVAGLCPRYLILRVSNAVGHGGNPNLLMNYLVRSVLAGETIDVHTRATRNLIDAEDIRHLTLWLIAQGPYNRIVNLAYVENYSIVEILQIMELHYGLRLNLNLIKKGSGYDIAIPEIQPYFLENRLMDKEAYLYGILAKYFPSNL